MQCAWARHERFHGEPDLEAPHRETVASFGAPTVLRANEAIRTTRACALPEHAHAVILKLGRNQPASHRVAALPQMGKQRRGGGGDGERAERAGGPQ